MYIPTIILAIITIILSAYNTKKDKTHKDEIYNLRKTMEAQHKLELSEQKEHLENLHKTEILKLNEELSKTKDGTLIPELETKIKDLEKELLNKQKELTELEKRMPFRYIDEARRCYEECYRDLLLIAKALSALNYFADIKRIISIHKSLEDQELANISNEEWLHDIVEDYISWERKKELFENEEN